MTITLRKSSNFLYSTGSLVGNPIAVGGINKAVQFNDNGVFAGDSTFTFDKTTKTLTAKNLSGSLTTLSDGSPYIIAGSDNISIITTSLGGIVISSSAGGGGGGSGITQITGSVLASGAGVVGGTVVNIDGQAGFIGQYAQGFIDTLMLEPSFNGSTNGRNFNMIAADSTNPFDSMAILSTNRNPGNGLAHLYIGKTYRPSEATIQTEIHSQGVVASFSNGNLGTTVESDNYGHVMTTVASSLAFTRQERFTGNFTTDGTSQGSLLLEAAIPGSAGGATLTIRAFPYPGGPGSRSGRVYIVSDVLGTLSTGNALSVADAQGRTFNGAASPYVMDKAYESNTFILDSTQNNWIVISSKAVDGGGGGDTFFYSTIAGAMYTSGSTAFAGMDPIASPADKGADVFFYVSGSIGTGTDKSLFGGDVFVSGSMTVESGIDVLTSGVEVTGSLAVTGSILLVGDMQSTGSIIPGEDKVFNLGSPDKRWDNVYTGDLHLRNERGNWTIVEEEDYLCVINNITGKKYKMMLQPIE